MAKWARSGCTEPGMCLPNYMCFIRENSFHSSEENCDSFFVFDCNIMKHELCF